MDEPVRKAGQLRGIELKARKWIDRDKTHQGRVQTRLAEAERSEPCASPRPLKQRCLWMRSSDAQNHCTVYTGGRFDHDESIGCIVTQQNSRLGPHTGCCEQAGAIVTVVGQRGSREARLVSSRLKH